jgi:signal transduction histidine kinase
MLIFITLIPLTILEIYQIKSNFTESINRELDTSQDYCEAISNTFVNYIDKIWTNEFSIGQSISLNQGWSEEDIEAYLKKVFSDEEDILSYTWIKPNGDVVASTSTYAKGKNLIDREYMQEILNGKVKVLSNLRVTIDRKNLVIPVARAIKHGDELKGVIVANIDVYKLYKIFPTKRIGEMSKYGIIDKNGRIVYRNGSSDLPFEKRLIPKSSFGWIALKGEIVRYASKISDYDGTERMGVEYPIKEFGWSCYATSSVSEVTGMHLQRIRQSLILLLIICTVSFIMAFLIGKQHIYSMNRLINSSTQTLDVNVSYNTNKNTFDEYDEVAKVFDRVKEDFNRRINEVEEYNNLKAQFLATMSHELKTPLNIILGCVQLMERQVEDSKPSNKYLKMLRQNSYRLLRLINNFIDINKMEVDNVSLNLINDDIIRVVEDISMSVVEYTNLKSIEFVFDTEVEEKYMAFDPDKMERILLNLLSNAIKFTESGGSITVTIKDMGEAVGITVKDSGIGIPKDMQERIFERFVQVDNTLRRRAEGSGIGLSLVRSLVELHGGKITVCSELGKGSEFSIELPAKIVEKLPGENIEKSLANVERIKIEFSDIYM